jgi:MFS family permease
MAFEPANSLRSRTYVGLIAAQFLAAFNDQAIHASAMFFAINKDSLSEAKAISLMPILFYAPWALFSTVAGWLADRYSKRQSLVFWKLAEVAITLVALLGFWLGSGPWHSAAGPWIVLFTVFLMGTHSAFFVPAKYGSMPEILQPHLLSRGNGILESTSFLAVILGTVCGGILSDDRVFKNREYWIGGILVVLAVIGAVASLLIQKIPAANPTRPFPVSLPRLRAGIRRKGPVLGWLSAIPSFFADLYRPLSGNLRVLLSSRPLRLALLGIAFFTFLVAYMRSSVYMHGESQIPRWHELKTSLVVGTTALGVSLGGLLAGFFSGGKVELGLVPLGALGMIGATVIAAVSLFFLPGLIVCIILIGFFAGFYTLPMFALMQHRAPKTSIGDAIATSNLINVLGATLASFLFFILVLAAERTGLAPSLSQNEVVARGELRELTRKNGRPSSFEVRSGDPQTGLRNTRLFETKSIPPPPAETEPDEILVETIVVDEGLYELMQGGLESGYDSDGSTGEEVIVTTYDLRGVTHYQVSSAKLPPRTAYDHERVPQFLFLGAGFITLCSLTLLCRLLPDFPLRSVLWLRSLGRYRLQVLGVNHLPSNGPAILATNAVDLDSCIQVLCVTDRLTRFFLPTKEGAGGWPGWLRFLLSRTNWMEPPADRWSQNLTERMLARSVASLQKREMLGLPEPLMDTFLDRLRQQTEALIVPVYRHSVMANSRGLQNVQIVFGVPLPAHTPAALVRREIDRLGAWVEQSHVDGMIPASTLMIPEALAALPTAPVADLPAPPSSV